MMDKRAFNVNGTGTAMLRDTIKLVMAQTGTDSAKAWSFSPKKGLIVFQYYDNNDQDIQLFRNGFGRPHELGLDELTQLVTDWLRSEEAQSTELDGWDRDSDHDGSNSLGWRVYVEDWGHVDNKWGVLFAITPSYLWYGK